MWIRTSRMLFPPVGHCRKITSAKITDSKRFLGQEVRGNYVQCTQLAIY